MEVKKPNKSLLFYAFVVMIILILLNALVIPKISERSVTETTYDEFLALLDAKYVKQVEIDNSSEVIYYEASKDGMTRICKTGRFNNDAVKIGLSFLFTLHQTDEVFSQVASNGAANAAVVHRDDLFIFALNEKIIVDAFFTEFIFDDGYLLTVFFGENAVKKRGFSCAQKTGNDCDRN